MSRSSLPLAVLRPALEAGRHAADAAVPLDDAEDRRLRGGVLHRTSSRGRGLQVLSFPACYSCSKQLVSRRPVEKIRREGTQREERRSRTAATTNMMATPLKSQEVGAFRRTSDQVGCRCPPCVCYLSGRSAIPQMCLSSNSLPAPTCAAPQSPHTLPHRARARRCTATRRTCPCVTAAACPRALGWTDWHASTTR